MKLRLRAPPTNRPSREKFVSLASLPSKSCTIRVETHVETREFGRCCYRARLHARMHPTHPRDIDKNYRRVRLQRLISSSCRSYRLKLFLSRKNFQTVTSELTKNNGQWTHFRPWLHGWDIDHLPGPRFSEARIQTGGTRRWNRSKRDCSLIDLQSRERKKQE